MSTVKTASNDIQHYADRWTSRVLRLGVWVSASLMIAGLLVAAIHPSDVAVFSSNPTLGNLLIRALSGMSDPETLMYTGLVFLMFTPILRVITALMGFAKEHDWRFVVISSVVLLLLAGELLYSIAIKG